MRVEHRHGPPRRAAAASAHEISLACSEASLRGVRCVSKRIFRVNKQPAGARIHVNSEYRTYLSLLFHVFNITLKSKITL